MVEKVLELIEARLPPAGEVAQGLLLAPIHSRQHHPSQSPLYLEDRPGSVLVVGTDSFRVPIVIEVVLEVCGSVEAFAEVLVVIVFHIP